MNVRLLTRGLLKYGTAWARGKAALVLLLAITLGGAPAYADNASAVAEEVRVMTFGDSLTAGYGLKPEDGFLAQLGDWLRKHGTPDDSKVLFLNGSVSGSTTAGGVRRLDWALGDAPDAMIVELGGNDLLRGVDPAETRANLEKILARAKAEGIEVLLIGLIAGDNYGPEYRAAFNAIYPDLARTYGTLLEPDFFTALPSGAAGWAPYMQGDGTHPNAQGVALIVAEIGPKVQALIVETLRNRQ